MQKSTRKLNDTLEIENLALETVLGVRPDERLSTRKVIVDIALERDLSRPGRTDELRDTVDWAALCTTLRQWARSRSFRLAEAFAEALAARILAGDPSIEAVSVRVRKMGAFPDAPETVPSVAIRRSRA